MLMLKQLDCRKKRTFRILLMILVAFCICWTPDNVLYFCFQFSGMDSSMWNKDYFQVAVLLGFSNSFINCVLYAFICDEFRGHFSTTFPITLRSLNCLVLTCKGKKNVRRKPLIKSDEIKRNP